jgi:hypothetical protein
VEVRDLLLLCRAAEELLMVLVVGVLEVGE